MNKFARLIEKDGIQYRIELGIDENLADPEQPEKNFT